MSHLEVALGSLLSKVLLPPAGSSDDLLMFDRPLGSFSARVDVAYRLGLIDSKVHACLHWVRRIRNEFAHGLMHTSIDIPKIRDCTTNLADACKRLDGFGDWEQLIEAEGRTGYSAQLRAAILLLTLLLEEHGTNVKPVLLQACTLA